jgi:hypothetical protein
MSLPCVSDSRTERERRCGTKVTPDAIANFVHADPTKAYVINYFGKLVSDGHAQWHLHENGDIRIRFHTGEIFLLAETTVTRIA